MYCMHHVDEGLGGKKNSERTFEVYSRERARPARITQVKPQDKLGRQAKTLICYSSQQANAYESAINALLVVCLLRVILELKKSPWCL